MIFEINGFRLGCRYEDLRKLYLYQIQRKSVKCAFRAWTNGRTKFIKYIGQKRYLTIRLNHNIKTNDQPEISYLPTLKRCIQDFKFDREYFIFSLSENKLIRYLYFRTIRPRECWNYRENSLLNTHSVETITTKTMVI